MYLIGGILWLLFGIGFVIFLQQFLTGGAGLQLFGDLVFAPSPGSVLFGLIYFVGLTAVSAICFVVALYLFSRVKFFRPRMGQMPR